jgi:hypothetical protein
VTHRGLVTRLDEYREAEPSCIMYGAYIGIADNMCVQGNHDQGGNESEKVHKQFNAGSLNALQRVAQSWRVPK